VRDRWISCVLPLAAVAAARLGVALGGAAILSCEMPASPPPGATALVQPDVFTVWWQEVEACSGATGDLSRVAWYQVPCEAGENGFACEATPDGLCAGEWVSPHTIELGGPNRFFPGGYATDEWTVKHEMLHDLLGTPDHPVQFENCHLLLR
jgi:hypothetical protein